jgi:hypothetical protein
VGDNIQIIGQGYVAVTPKCAMAGGSLHMSLSVGPVDAYCDMVLDVFINFKPFYFVASLSISVGVECSIDLLFVTIHISISIGADLSVWGPNSFGGNAYVDFWFFGFSVSFGDDSNIPGAALLSDFYYNMLRVPGPGAEPPSTDTTTAQNPYLSLHKYTIEQGLYPTTPKSDGPTSTFPNTGAATDWVMQTGALTFRIDVDFAVSSAVIVVPDGDGATATTKENAVPWDTGPNTVPSKICSTPMKFPDDENHEITSSVKIRVYINEPAAPAPAPTAPAKGVVVKDGVAAATGGGGGSVGTGSGSGSAGAGQDNSQWTLIPGFTGELVTKNASKAMWGPYIRDQDPLMLAIERKDPPSDLTNGEDPNLKHCFGVRLFSPPSMLAQSPILDVDATEAMQAILGPYTRASEEPVQEDFLATAFEATKAKTKQWPDFGAMWAGTSDRTTTEGLSKAEIRGDSLTGSMGASGGSDGGAKLAKASQPRSGTSKVKADLKETDTDPTLSSDPLTPGTGMLGLLVTALGWNRPNPANKDKNVPVPGADGRYPWQLVTDPPSILASELQYYYPALPLVTGAAA